MEILLPFLNRHDLSQYISVSMSNILAHTTEFDQQEKELEKLTRLFDALPPNFHPDPIPIACQLFDHLLQNASTIHQHRLLSSCLHLMKMEDRLHRITRIFLIILDHEQPVELRELLCKLLSTIDATTSTALTIDWTRIESAIRSQHDPKYLTYLWRFLAKHYQTNLEQMLVRTLPLIQNNDELLLLLTIELRSIRMFINMPSFWYLLQRALGDSSSNNDRMRKCAL